MPNGETIEAIQERENPFRRWTDLSSFSSRLRYFLKAFPKSFNYFGKYFHYNEIYITREGRKIFLGAIPTEKTWKQFRRATIRFSMLTAEEEEVKGYKDAEGEVIHFPTLDHSIVDQTTGQNITYEKFKQTMLDLKSRADQDIYFHCMAGKSRSLMTLIGYLYLNNNNSLQDKLPSDIAGFVKTKRPQAKKFQKLDGHQKGFLGLITLHKELEAFEKGLRLNENKLREIAQHIGLMLQLPLDRCFRNQSDRQSEEADFIKMYEYYRTTGINKNLLSEMLIPFGSKDRGYKGNFDALTPSVKMHFAILAQTLFLAGHNQDNHTLPLNSQTQKYMTPADCAKTALKDIKKLTPGDLVEFLRTFGKDAKPFREFLVIYIAAVDKIAGGSKVDTYRSGKQLAELYFIAKTQGPATSQTISPIIESRLSKLNYLEQYSFVMELEANNDINTQKFAKIVLTNHNKKSLLNIFKKPLPATQFNYLSNLAIGGLIIHRQKLATPKKLRTGESLG